MAIENELSELSRATYFSYDVCKIYKYYINKTYTSIHTCFIESHNVVSEAGPSCGDHDASTHVLAKLLAELRGLQG